MTAPIVTMLLIVAVYGGGLGVAWIRYRRDRRTIGAFMIKASFLVYGLLVAVAWVLDDSELMHINHEGLAIAGVFVYAFAGIAFLLLEILDTKREQ